MSDNSSIEAYNFEVKERMASQHITLKKAINDTTIHINGIIKLATQVVKADSPF